MNYTYTIILDQHPRSMLSTLTFSSYTFYASTLGAFSPLGWARTAPVRFLRFFYTCFYACRIPDWNGLNRFLRLLLHLLLHLPSTLAAHARTGEGWMLAMGRPHTSHSKPRKHPRLIQHTATLYIVAPDGTGTATGQTARLGGRRWACAGCADAHPAWGMGAVLLYCSLLYCSQA